ncbi:MAG: carbohydrate kinase family protein [Crenarchaeota archaeon]|nr:carbohydrate kinase family protein [Thermoproteota archaeon]
MKPIILGIAAINKDHIVLTDDPVEDVENAVSAEEFRKYLSMYEPHVRVGGSVVNTLYAAKQVDDKACVKIHGVVGDDPDGEWIISKLRDLGLKYIGYVMTGEETGKTLILSSRKGSRRIFVYPGANDLFCRDLVYPLEGMNVDVIHTSTFACTRGIEPLNAQILAYEIVNSSIRSLMLGSLYCSLYKDERYRPYIDELLKNVDIVFARLDELYNMYNDPLTIIDKYSTNLVIATMGERGVRIYTKDGTYYEFPAPKVDTIVDTTGAGDAFAGGFLIGVVRGMELKDCVKLGMDCARECLRNIGGTEYKIRRG